MAIRIGTGAVDPFNLTGNSNYNFGLEDDRVVGLGGDDIIATGAGNDFLDGGDNNDICYDGDGNDTVIAGAGNDIVFVDAGNDIYYGGNGSDTLSFAYIHDGISGAVQVTFGIKFDLGSTAVQNLDELGFDQFFGFEDVTAGFGNDTIFGSDGDNFIGNEGGDDLLYGRGGNDVLWGAVGAETFIGGLGQDDIFVAAGVADNSRDIVRYESLKDSGTTDATRDVISWFTHGQDKIDLSKLDANLGLKGNQAFKVVKGFTKAFGEVKLVYSGADTIVQVDGDKDKAVDMTILVKGVYLTKGDFIL
jgi:Ca2+-binding RTX toxin-like protein